ncbi:MAG: bifunctional folylpolyglutamate synthase/dihydrofolate synthase [Oscillospiraceae bacterium]|nr:bifunctional folylpolyglutamate synthase/dihydrofolate synthase [Oscillospiraceae bacterium]
MNYEESIKYIHSTPKFSRVLGNDVLRKLLRVLGDPQKTLRFIHIGGTNGKGSVSAVCASVLKEAGYVTGMFTSPYIERFNERIRINGVPIEDGELAECVTAVREAMEKSGYFVSEFALGMTAAFLYFKKKKCDFVVLEVGMGGLLDGTNVIDESIVTVITLIGLDHTRYLGDTIERIAAEKCGIIKEGGRVVTYPKQKKEALGVIREYCDKKNAGLIIPGMPERTGTGFIYNGKIFEFPLIGSYQPYNAVMAIEAIEVMRGIGINITDESIYEGIKKVRWPARCEKVIDDPEVYIDGAHNPDGMSGLCDTIKYLRDINGKKVYIAAAMMEDKNIEDCIGVISEISDRFYAARFDDPRCAGAEYTAAYSKCRDTVVCPDAEDAIKRIIKDARDDGNAMVWICGSLYFAGRARKFIRACLVSGNHRIFE